MKRHRFLMTTRLVWLVAAVFWVVGLGLAQMQPGGKSHARRLQHTYLASTFTAVTRVQIPSGTPASRVTAFLP